MLLLLLSLSSSYRSVAKHSVSQRIYCIWTIAFHGVRVLRVWLFYYSSSHGRPHAVFRGFIFSIWVNRRGGGGAGGGAGGGGGGRGGALMEEAYPG